MKAEITWMSKTKEQKELIILNGRYTTVVKFAGQTESDWQKEAWSLTLTNFKIVSDDKLIADVAFLALNAPSERLSANKKFELFEGPKCTAWGVILEQ